MNESNIKLTNKLTNHSILDIPLIEHTDTNSKTIGDYLRNLLLTLWIEKESFNGKRPFGNSGWEYDIYKSLIVAGVVKGVIDEDGCIDEFSDSEEDEADKIIRSLIIKMIIS